MKPAACSWRVITSLIFEPRSEFEHVEVFLAGDAEDALDALAAPGCCPSPRGSPAASTMTT
jgi:hypothetical protein